MKIDKYTSERLMVLRFPLIVGVVYGHSYWPEIFQSNAVMGIDQASFFSDFIRKLISQEIARVTVPLFFLMSGYFFFLDFSWSIENFKNKINDRIKTLLVPFLFWNILTLSILALAQTIPATQVFFSGKNAPIATFGGYDYLNAIFGMDGYPISYQFWFIRDLMIMVLVSPALYLGIKKMPKIVFLVIFILWFFNCWKFYIPAKLAVVFFFAGAYFAMMNISLFALDRFCVVILFFYWMSLFIDVFTKNCALNFYVHNINLLLGLVSALYLSKSIVSIKFMKKALLWAGTCSFFVFAAHEPLLTIVKKIIYKLVSPDTDVLVLFLYFTIPIITIALSLLFYIILKSIAPRFLKIISGGR
ncbi:MAG: acyltransferase [Candidatus Magnetomorum sp.]|nr:acyltransferase [Candidatus Magnetomorum sp.]